MRFGVITAVCGGFHNLEIPGLCIGDIGDNITPLPSFLVDRLDNNDVEGVATAMEVAGVVGDDRGDDDLLPE